MIKYGRLNMDEERQKKLQAGKEKFAQFLKKKHKQEPHNETNKKRQRKEPLPSSQKEIGHIGGVIISDLDPNPAVETKENQERVALQNDAEVEMKKFKHPSEESEQLQISSPSEAVRNDFADNSEVHNEEILLDSPAKREFELKSKFEECNKKLEEYRSALNHRDEVISQLTLSLQTTINQRDKLQSEATLQSENLASEINLLKLQLQQASELLRNQRGKNGISDQELLDAKNKLLILENDSQQRETSMNYLINENKELLKNNHSLELQLKDLKLKIEEYRNVVDTPFENAKIELERLRKEQERYIKCHEELHLMTEECNKLKQIQELYEAENLQGLKGCNEKCEEEKKQLNEALSSLREEKHNLSVGLEKGKKEIEEVHVKLRNSVQQQEFMKADLQNEIDRLNSCLYLARRDADAFKSHHFSEIKRLQHCHLEEIEQMRKNSEECYKQTVGELNSKLKQMHNELLSLKSTATELELCKQKHAIELEEFHSDCQKRSNEYECKITKLVRENNIKEGNIKKLESELASVTNKISNCDECEELQTKLNVSENEVKYLRELKRNNSSDSPHMDWDIAINLGDVTKEILNLRTENEKLKSLIAEHEIVHIGSVQHITDMKSDNKDFDMIIDSFEEERSNDNSVETWRQKYDNLLAEKLNLELQLHELVQKDSDDKLKCDSNLNDNDKSFDILMVNNEQLKDSREVPLEIRCLQEKLKDELVLREKLFQLLKDQENFKEKYMNDISLLEKIKHDLELELHEATSSYQILLKDKQNLEKDLCNLKLDLKSISSSSSSPSDLSKEPKLESQQLCEQIVQLENTIVLLKLKIQHEMDLKNTLNSQLLHLNNRYKKCEHQIKFLKNDKNILQNQLETSLKQQEKCLQQLINEQDRFLQQKLKHEKEISSLQEQLKSVVNTREEEQITVKSAYMLEGKELSDQSDNNAATVDNEMYELPLNNSIQNVEESAIILENNILKESLQNERIKSEQYRKELENAGLSPTEIDYQIEAMEMQYKLRLLMESNKSILQEKNVILNHLKAQENLLTSLQKKIDDPQEQGNDLLKQLNSVHEQQRELINNLQKQQEKEFQVFNILEGKNIFQETLRQEKELLLEKMKEKEHLEQDLLQHRLELERLSYEKHRLEDLITEKERLEEELTHQRKLLESQLAIFEHRLQERENIIRKERAALQLELQRKDLVIHKWQSDYKEKQVEYQHLHSCLKAEQDVAIATLHERFQKESLHRIEEIRTEMDHCHTIAIARLQQDLQNQFAVRESEIVIKYSAQVSLLQGQHKEQLKLLQEEYKNKLEEMNLLAKEDAVAVDKLTASNCFQEELDKLRSTLNEAEIDSFDRIHAVIEKHYKEEMNIFQKQLQTKLEHCFQYQREQIELQHKNEILAIEAKAEESKNIAVAKIQDNLTKAHKEELNVAFQNYQRKGRQMEKNYHSSLLELVGLNEINSESLFHLLYREVINEFRKSVQNLNLQWESKYLEELAALREEIEEKFKNISSDGQQEIQEDSSPSEDIAVATNDENFTQIEQLIEKREQLVKKIEEMRQSLEQICTSEVGVLKDHLQEEFDSMKELQNKMKEDLQSNQSPVLVELHKIKEEYEILQEKYEEIVKEQVEVNEYVLKKPDSQDVPEKKTETDRKAESEKMIEKEAVNDLVKDELQKLKVELEIKHSQEMDELRKYFEKQCDNMEKKYVDEVKIIKESQQNDTESDMSLISQCPRPPTLTHFCDAYTLESNVLDVEEHYKKEMEQKLNQYCSQLEEVRKDLELKHSAAIEAIEKEYEAKLEKELEKTRIDLLDKYSQQIEDLLAKHNEELCKYQKSLSSHLPETKLQYSTEIAEEIEKECNKLHAKLKSEHQQNLEMLQNELELKHKREIEIIRAHLEAEKAEEINEAILKLRRSLQQQRYEIENNVTASSEEVIIDELSEMASNNAITKAQLKEKWKNELECEVRKENEERLRCFEDELQKTKSMLDDALSEKDNENQKHAQERENLLSKLKRLNEEIENLQQDNKNQFEKQECGTQSEFDEVSATQEKEILPEVILTSKEHEIALQTLRDQFVIEMKNLQDEHNGHVKKLEVEWQNTLHEHILQKEKDLSEYYTEELKRLKQSHLQEIAEERDRLQEDLTSDHITKFEAVTHAIDSSHQLELEELRQNLLREHEETVEQLRHDMLVKEKEFQVMLEEMKENHEKDLDDLKTDCSKQLMNEMRKIKLDMEHASEEKLQAVALDTEVLKTELEDVHRKEILELQDKLNKKYHNELEIELKKTIEEMDEKLLKFTAKLNEEHAKEMMHMKQELQEVFESQLATAQKDLLKEKENELNSIREEYEEKFVQLSQNAKIKKWDSDSEIGKSHLSEEDETVPYKIQDLKHDDKELEMITQSPDHQEEMKETCDYLNTLQQELEKLRAEKEDSFSTIEHLKTMLSELLKSYMAIEMTISKQLTAIASEETAEAKSPSLVPDSEDNAEESITNLSMEVNPLSFLSEDGIDLELSQRIPENIFDENTLDAASEEIVYSTSTNLQLAIKRLLHLLSLTVQQCHESKLAQLELVNAACRNGEEAVALQARIEELQNQLHIEIEAKDHLTLELHKAAGLLNGYESEKNKWEFQSQGQEEAHRELIEQLEAAQEKINTLENTREDFRRHLEYQRSLLAEGLTDKEQLKTDVSDLNQITENKGLLDENSHLFEKNKDLQQQSDKDRLQLTSHVHKLEQAFEEQIATNEKLLEERCNEIDDLHQQIDSLEKQLKANKQFIEEQTLEREQEREESQNQIGKLQDALRDKERLQGTEYRLIHEVEMLNEMVQKQSEAFKNAIGKKDELEGVLHGMQDKVGDLKDIIRNLENQIDNKVTTESSLKEEISNLKKILSETTQSNDELLSEVEILRSASTSAELSSHVHLLEEQLEVKTKELESLNSTQSLMHELSFQVHKIEEKVERRTRELEALQLSASSVSSPSSEDISLRDQLEAMRSLRPAESQEVAIISPMFEIRRLEDKLESLAKAEEAAIKKTRDLEMLLKKQKHVEEELLQDKEALQHQVNNQLLQISSLQARIEEKRHNLDNAEAAQKISRLQDVIDRDHEVLEKKDKELEDIRDKLDQTMKLLVSREEELTQLNNSQQMQEKNVREIDTLKEENDCLRNNMKKLQEEMNALEIPTLTQELLDEKNHEIDELKQQLEEMLSENKGIQKDIMEQKDKELNEKIESLKRELDTQIEENKKLQTLLDTTKTEIESLQEITLEKDNQQIELEQKDLELKKVNEVATQRKREVDALRGVLKEKEELLEQVKTLQTELKDLTDYQHKLELEISDLKNTLSEKDKEVQSLIERLDLSVQNSAVKQDELHKEIKSLQVQLDEKNESIEIFRRQSLSSDEINLDTNRDVSWPLPKTTLEESIEPIREEESKDISSQTEGNDIHEEELNNLKAEINNLQSSLNDKCEENENLLNKLISLTSEKDSLICQIKECEHLKEEISIAKHQLELKEIDLNSSREAIQIEAIKNDIMKTLESNLKNIQQQLSLNADKKIEINEMAFAKELEGELKKTQDGLQQLQVEIQTFHKKNVDYDSVQKEKQTKDAVAEEKEIQTLEVQAVLSQSEIDRLHDEIEQYEEKIEKLQSLLEQEKQTIDQLQEQHQKEMENAYKNHKQEIERLQSQLQKKKSQSSSESDSTSESSQNSKIEKVFFKSFESDNNGPETEDDDATSSVPGQINTLLNKVHKEGVEVLSLSELLFLRSHSSNSQQMNLNWSLPGSSLQRSWENEKHQLLEEIMALKELLSQATEATASLRSTGEATTELTNMLLNAVATVFQKERALTLAELRTHILSSNLESPDELKRLEHKLAEMEEHQKEVLGKVQNLLEKSYPTISSDIEACLRKERLQHLQECEKLLNQIAKLEENLKNQEKNSERKMELLECQIQQEQRFEDELRTNLELEKKRTLDLTSQLSREKSVNANLEMSLALTKTELIKTQAALDKDKREIQNLTVTCESERFRSSALNQALESEQANFSQLQEAMEAEKRRAKSSSERQQQIIQELQRALEQSKVKQTELVSVLDRERLNLMDAYQEIESLKKKSKYDPNKKTSKSKYMELSQQHTDFNQASDLAAALERERQQVITLTNLISQERSTAAEELDRERTTNFQYKKNLEITKEQNNNLKRELQQVKEQLAHLEAERTHVQKQLSSLKEQEMRKAVDREVERELERENQREMELILEKERQKQQEHKLENQKLLQKIQVLEKQIQHLKETEKQLRINLEMEQEQISKLSGKKKTWITLESPLQHSSEIQRLESIKQKFHALVLKGRMELENTLNRGAGDSRNCTLYQILKTLLEEINQIKIESIPLSEDESNLSHFVEQVLHQNAELIGFVSKLCEDKMELRKHQTKLEDELVELRHKEMLSEQSLRRSLGTTNETLTTERSSWAQERATLQLALHKAEAKVMQLSSDIKSQGIYHSYELLPTSGTPRSDSKWQNLHLKYLRAESYRKALIYQKKYLLILLGGFQDTEAATLAMISQMGLPSQPLKEEARDKSPILRFRSAARAIIAVNRMKYLVRRWKSTSTSSPSPYGSHQDLCSRLNQRDFSFRKIHRVGTTPPVRESQGSRTSSERSSTSTARRNILHPTTSDITVSSHPQEFHLQQYIERMDSLHFRLNSSSSSHVDQNK